jgi:hypothetical protein
MARPARHSPANVADSATRHRERTRGFDERTREIDERTRGIDERTRPSTNEPENHQDIVTKGVLPDSIGPARGRVPRFREIAERTRIGLAFRPDMS